ncbi:MAG: hypothetical protein U0527_03685 [Candidatus Eisenbacteria bacterium]
MARTKSILLLALLVIAATASIASSALADVPRTMSYQGILRNADTSLVPDGNYQLTFRLYEAATGGSPVWAETQVIAVSRGLFNATLGAVAPLSMEFDHQYWLSTQVGGEAELAPRVMLASAPSALNSSRAAEADKVDGLHAADMAHSYIFSIAGGGGSLTITTPPYLPFTIVLSAPHASPHINDIGYVNCIENDYNLAWQGIDGTGVIIRGTASFNSNTTILSIAGGAVTLSTPNAAVRNQLIVTSSHDDVRGYLVY